jgi:magnesium chelatase subunit I
MQPMTLGELRRAIAAGDVARRSVHAEVRANLIAKLRAGQQVFPGIIGYDETVIPQVVNAILSQHNFILLGLRGQAKTRLLRALTGLLDEYIPIVAGTEINDDPLAPLSAYARRRVAEEGDAMPIAWRHRDDRYVEKLATPDVTIADIIGDIDPIKAARGGMQLSDELTMHFGLLPRANRCIFAINELPDLAGKIQVGLFNILQEGDVQIKGYPVRLPLDVMMVFSANPEDYTARGKIITPLKDRIGSEVRTHYPVSRDAAIAITAQEAWTERDRAAGERRGSGRFDIPAYIREIVEEVAFQARADQKVDKRSGVSQRLPISVLENVVSNAERRALMAEEDVVVPRVTDVYAALPAITGKFELEYEGELRGAAVVASDLIRAAVSNVFQGYFDTADLRPVIEWFEMGGTLQVSDTTRADELVEQTRDIQGLHAAAERAGVMTHLSVPAMASAVDFVLEGLHAQKKISRNEQWRYAAPEGARRPPRPAEPIAPEPRQSGGKKKYYN